MSAQSEFLSGMLGFRLALDHEAIVDNAPTDVEHNLRAKTFRNGIAILGFAVLEHFIRTRTGEICDKFDQINVPFDKLPEKLRQAATEGAFNGVRARLKYSDDMIRFAQSEASVIASSGTTRFKLSKYSFGFKDSNLSIGEIGSIMNAFGVKDGWKAISKSSTFLDLSIPDPQTAFSNASTRRHNAAHNINTLVNPSDLISFVREAYAIAIGFDLLLSSAFYLILIQDSNYLESKRNVTHEDLRVRKILRQESGKWAEFRLGDKRATRILDSEDSLYQHAWGVAKKQSEALVKFDASRFPQKWEFPGMPI